MTKFDYKKYQYYTLIVIISLFAVFLLPMLGSDADVGWNLPSTFVGWVVYVFTKILVAIINVLLFYCFMEQAKVNVKDNPYYIEANEILMRYGKLLPFTPRDPDSWERGEYKTKGITIAITTVLSAVGLTQAILTFDWVSMLTYFFTIVMGVVFGIIQMNKAETYWTTEYWQYAKMVERKMEMDKAGIPYTENDIAVYLRGTVVLESSNNDRNTCNHISSNVDSGRCSVCGMGLGTPGNTDTNCIHTNVQENLKEITNDNS